MSLRWKVILYLSAVFTLFIALSNVIFQSAVMPGIARIERDDAVKDLHTCAVAIKGDIDSLDIFLVTWSAWDDAYQFMTDGNAAFIKSNLTKETYQNEHLNLIWFCRPDGTLAYGQTVDANGQPAETKGFEPGELGPDHPLVRFFGTKDSFSGVVLTGLGPMLVAARPIVDSRNNGPIHGSLIMGRLLQDSEILKLSEQTRIHLHATAADPAHLKPDETEIVRLLQGGGTRLVEVSDQLFHAYTIANDIYGKPAILLRADIPRDMTAMGHIIVRTAMGMSIFGAGTILIALGWIIQRAVVRPLQRMSHHATLIGSRDNLTTRLNLNRKDEIGILGHEIDRMVSSLSESRARLVESAHRSGMLDVATDVLHNVGNAINTVNVTASVLERRLRDEDYGGICKAANMIGQHCARLNQVSNDELCGGEVHDYLNNLAELLESDRKQSLFDLGRLRQKVEHIHQIISTQLSHAASARFTPSEEFAAIMQSVLLMNDEALRSRGISVTTDIVNVSVLPMNKVKFMQVMNNMVINAIQAAPPTGGLINIHAWRDSHSIRIEVKDNGSGIKSGDLSLLFKLGFTTRRQGRGCGLHYCQTAIEEAGGKLIAESEGAGCGAKFTILLPATEETPKMETFDGQVATR